MSFVVVSRKISPYEVAFDEVDIIQTNVTKESRKDARTPLPPSKAAHPSSVANGKHSLPQEEEEEELEIKQTVVLGERDPQIVKTLLFGLPSPTSVLWSVVTVATNVVLATFVADLVYRAPLLYQSHDLSFVRVGFVSDTYAKLVIREPNTSKLPIYISYRRALESESSNIGDTRLEDPWKSADSIFFLSNETDYTYSTTILRLHPSTRYQYAVSNNLNGFFTTAPPIGQTAPNTDKFTFLTSSCIKPRFPYNPFAHSLSIPGFVHLAEWIPSLKASFMLFLGDFIYIDVPHRFGADIETYRREYRQVYSSPDWPAVSSSLRWIHVLDDHEIANDWDRNTTAPWPAAIDPFNLYQASVNPPGARLGASYLEFAQGPAAFFLMDTRRYRSPELAADPSSPNKSMLGGEQLASLLSFLSRREPTGVKWKIVVSSIPFTRNWRVNNADTWAGYLHERRILLEAMWDVGMRGEGVGVIVLSGDRHEFAATAFPPPKDGKWPLAATVHEFSTSPLSMFYLPVRTYWEVEGEDDVCIKYIPDGNSKFLAVEITNILGGEQSLLKCRLFVDGVETWSYAVTTPPPVVGGSRGKDAIWG